MPFLSSSVIQFNNTGGGAVKGLLQKVLDFVLGTEAVGELIGAGPGTIFAKVLVNGPVSPGQCEIEYTQGATTYKVTDDGAGNFFGTGITTGTIVYATKTVNLTFGVSTTNVLCNYIAGVAGQDWRLRLQQTSRDNLGAEVWSGEELQEVILENSGLSGQEKIIIGAREWKQPGIGAYGWDLNGYLQYVLTTHWNSNFPQTGRTQYGLNNHYTEHPVFALDDDAMNFWCYSNKQRIIVKARVSGNYEGCYLGFGRRFGAPSSYPFPLLIIGSLFGDLAFTDVSDDHHFIAGPSRVEGFDKFAAWIVDPANNYKITQDVYFVPYHDQTDKGSILDPTTDSPEEYKLLPVYLVDNVEGNTLMDLDGVKLIAGTGIQSEDRVQITGPNYYKVFQDIFRNNYWQFLGIEEA